jgi:hypothetical protein
MSQRFDALTGQLAFILAVSTVLALAASWLILHFYRRAVTRSMRWRRRSEILEPKGYLPPEPEHPPHDAPLSFHFITRDTGWIHPEASVLYRRAIHRQWLIASVHIVAGCCFASAMAAAFISARQLDFSPFRFAFIAWAYAWPVSIAVDLVAGLSRLGRLVTAAVYFLIGAVAGTLLLMKNPGLSPGQLLYLWLQFNAVPAVLLLIFLHRRIRAVGPLILILMILSITGSTLAVTMIGNHQKLFKVISAFSRSIGLGAAGTRAALYLIGFATFALLAWLVVETLRKLHERKLVSEPSVPVDATWLVFGVVNSLPLLPRGSLWFLSGLAAFAFYKLLADGLFRALGVARRAQRQARRLLVLRPIALGRRAERLYDTLGKSWLTVGSMQWIAGPDLAGSTIQPHEFMDFVSGRVDRRFIDTGRALDLRVDHMDLTPDREGQFRVTEFFCHDDTWDLTFARLADESDAVLMDLRGFSQGHTGCVREINELVNLVPLQRVVFAIDQTTDQSFTRDTVQHAWRQVKDRSPNRRAVAGKAHLVQLDRNDADKDLLFALCAAAAEKTPSAGG